MLARGGELRDDRPERAIDVGREWVSVWGITEVPDGVRLQLALSGVDAITRAELLKALRVRVQSLVTSMESTDPKTHGVEVATAESVTGLLDRAAPLPHGWARVRRGKHLVMRLWARLTVRRADLEAALGAPLANTGRDVAELIDGLALEQETP